MKGLLNMNKSSVSFWVTFLLGIAFFFLYALILMLLWNIIIPQVFGLSTITYAQSLGLYLIANILFKVKIFNKIK